MSYKDLTQRFIDICNQAIMLHKFDFPYKQLLEITEPLFEGKKWGLAIYDKNPKTLHDFYTLEYKDHKFAILEHGDVGADYCWKVPEDYLKEVTENPGAYLEHPEKLDWEWLKHRMNIS